MAIDLIPPVLKTLSFPSTVDISQGTGAFKIVASADGTGSEIAYIVVEVDKILLVQEFFDTNPSNTPYLNSGLALYGYSDNRAR